MKIIWTKHAEDRQREWEKRLEITREEVEDIVRNPEQIVCGDMNVSVAQTRIHNGLLRIPFVKSGGKRKILTLYWTSKTDKYWKEEI